MNRSDDRPADATGDHPSRTPEDDPLMTADPLETYDPDRRADLDTSALHGPQGWDVGGGSDPAGVECATLAEEEQSLITEVCEKFESDWEQASQEPSVERYVAEDLEVGLRQILVRELVLLDIEHRKKRNKTLPPTEYLSRFSDCRNAVEAAFTGRPSNVPRGYGTTAVPTGNTKNRGASQPQHANDATSRYRPTKIHARGGLGAVYSARDTELNRVVALKEILPEHSMKTHYQQKFVFEAEVTGSLEHPGIVPVYGLGRYQDGSPYYAMRFVRGHSFRALIGEFHERNSAPSAETYLGRDFRKLLRHLIETCYAIHYAHEHGVLHRDIKPENIMLGNYGETLVVDWGLAKFIQSKTDAEDQPTQIHARTGGSHTSPGSAVGTPMYMSPEQAYGHHDQLDGRSDVYALGVVLFNIVTSGHPIEGKSTPEVLANVRAGRTKSLHSIFPSAPRALASICRKAMELDPADRYTTAVELAEDIDRWMSDEIVQAHIGHETVTERAGRLIRRHKSWTISGAAALLVITTVAIVSALLINTAKHNEEIAKRDAVERYRDSRDAIDTWLVQSSDALQFFPGTRAVRKRLLQLSTEDYEKLSQRPSRDPELELERGRALVKLGDLNQLQQDYETARTHYASALKVFATTADDQQLLLRLRSEHGNVHARIGLAYAGEDRAAEADDAYRSAIAELTKLAGVTEDSLPQRLLASAHVNLGAIYLGTGKFSDAIGQLSEGLARYDQIRGVPDDKRQLSIARTRELLGRVYMQQGEHENASNQFRAAIEALLPLVQAEPDHPEYLDALASAYVSESTSFRTRGLEKQTLAALTSAVEHFRALQEAIPDAPTYKENLGLTLTDLGLTLHESGSNPEAVVILNQAHDLLQGLAGEYGQVPRIHVQLATCRDALGQVYLDASEDAGKASLYCGNAASSFDQIIQTLEVRPEYFERLAVARSHLAQTLQRQGMPDKAKTEFQNAISILEALIEEQEKPSYSNALAHVHDRYAELLHALEDPQAAMQFEIARDLWIGIGESRVATYTHDLAFLLATCPIDSLRDADAALQYASDAVSLAAENSHFLTTQALASLNSGRTDDAVLLLQKAVNLRGHPIDRDFFVLAMIQERQGQSEDARESFQKGSDWLKENRPFHADMLRLREMAEQRITKQAS